MELTSAVAPVVCLGGIIIFVLFIWAIAGIRIVRPHQKALIERFGKYQKTLDSGLHIIIPLVDKLTKVDMRENVVDVPPQEVITERHRGACAR
jgi:regulator of protease activity HflC (stomatin/prohibitin superfamily)